MEASRIRSIRTRQRSCPPAANVRATRPCGKIRASDSCRQDATIACRTSGLLIPTPRKTRNALATMATRLVTKRRPAPPMISRFRPPPRPKPIAQSGGITATAIATPGSDSHAIAPSAANHDRTRQTRQQPNPQVEQIGIRASKDLSRSGMKRQQPNQKPGKSDGYRRRWQEG